MSPELRKVDENQRVTRYAYRHLKGWLVAALGVLMGYVGRDLESFGDWGLVGLGVLLALLGLAAALYRMELVLDFGSRRFRYRKGFLGFMDDGAGPFDEIREVVLEREIEVEEPDDWEVKLIIEGWSSHVEVAESKEEQVARETAERLADRIGVPLRETTDA